MGIVLYKYYPPARVDILERKVIYFSDPAVFNDPFEGEPFVEAAAMQPMPALAGAGVVPINWDLVGYQKDLLKDRKRHVLVFSGTEEADNILMWAHYSGGHEGFAIGFNATEKSFANRADGSSRRLERVNYMTQRPRGMTVDEIREQDMLLTKSLHWQHEKEWRMFENVFNSDENAPVVPGVWGFNFEPKAVDRVLLGARIKHDTEQRIRKVLLQPEYHHVKLIKGRSTSANSA